MLPGGTRRSLQDVFPVGWICAKAGPAQPLTAAGEKLDNLSVDG